MTDLTKLRVSLTKHGAHKLSILLQRFEKDAVLENLSGKVQGVNIEQAQARANLSVGRDGIVPDLWNEAKSLGADAISALVLIAIATSHHQIIEALIKGSRGSNFSGAIKRGEVLDAKAFTNFSNVLQELGFSTSSTVDKVTYDFSSIFRINGLGILAAKLLTLKLRKAGWDHKTLLTDELILNNIHTAFSISESDFKIWLATDIPDFHSNVVDTLAPDQDEEPAGQFTFNSGHKPRREGSIALVRKKEGVATLLHNQMLTRFHEIQVSRYGAANVGTENATGKGTYIDLVVKHSTHFDFYEMKTSRSVKACIRQAIPQLLEYSCWGDKPIDCQRLVVVGPNPITKDASRYLDVLRNKFALPIFYERCVMEEAIEL